MQNEALLLVVKDILDSLNSDFSLDGGILKFGVSCHVLKSSLSEASMESLNYQDAISVHDEIYWRPMNLGVIYSEVSEKLASLLFSCAIDCGTCRAGLFLQKSVIILGIQYGIREDLVLDGIIGNKTLSAVRDVFSSYKSKEDLSKDLFSSIYSMQIEFYSSLLEKRFGDFRVISKRIRNIKGPDT